MEQNISKKIFHICMIIVIIVAILFAVGILVLRYQVEGETNLPFELSKIAIVSSVDATSNEDVTNRWNLNINQNNDIYLYIEKNNNYGKTEIIDNITLDNFVINKTTEIGEAHLYKPSNSNKVIFENTQENLVDTITYTGDLESNVKELKISNQGGLVTLRCANDNVATYVSNELEQIDYSKLLKTTNTDPENLKANISFDLSIKLTSGKLYKANVKLDLPVGDVVEEGTSSQEITDLSNVIFKRIENN